MGALIETVIIANPAAGAGRAGERLLSIERAVFDTFGRATLQESDLRTTVATHVRNALLRGARRLVVVGGDGTVNEAVNGYFAVPEAQRDNAEFLFLPAGTGGDFARVLGTRGLAVDTIVTSSTPRKVDAGSISFGDGSVHHFLNIASLGVSAAIAHRVNFSSKRAGGNVSFVLGTLAALLQWRDVRVRVRIDDAVEKELSATCIAVANGRYFGSGMMIAPNALLNDGLLDIILLDGVGALTFVAHAHKLYAGKHLCLKGVSVYRGKRVTVKPLSGPFQLEADGECPGDAPVEIRIVPQSIRILAPWERVGTTMCT